MTEETKTENTKTENTKTTKTKKRYLAATIADFVEAKRMIVVLKGIEIGVFKVKDAYYAWRNMCPHAAAPVCEGTICGTKLTSNVYEYIYGRDNEILRCPWHGWEFDLISGQHLASVDVKLRGYEIEVEDEQIYVLI